MKITISAELEIQLQQNATAEGLTVEAYVERLISEDAAWAKSPKNPSGKSTPNSTRFVPPFPKAWRKPSAERENQPAKFSPSSAPAMEFRVDVTPRAQEDLDPASPLAAKLIRSSRPGGKAYAS